jgi:hypothetical protein
VKSARVLVALLVLVAARLARGEADVTCALATAGEAVTTRDCVACHTHADASMNHPVDVDYQAAVWRRASTLRPLEVAVKRGAFIPEGQVRCTSCHERTSPWKYHLAIPAGAGVHRAVVRGDPSTYESGSAGAALLPPGSDVGRKPLCLTCHAFE